MMSYRDTNALLPAVRKDMRSYAAVRHRDGRREPVHLLLIEEEPLAIHIDGYPYSVVMRTPGDERCHAAGFCLTEGIIDSMDDVESLESMSRSGDSGRNVVNVRLTPQRRKRIPDVLERTGFVSQTSCGICGKHMIDDLFQIVTPMDERFRIDAADIPRCIDALSAHQECYDATRGSHAALILDGMRNTIAFSEDVGRHNALDKSIGKALRNGRLSDARILVLASRVSFELVQKAARAGIPVIVSYSRPTSMAVRMAGPLNMTLAFPDTEEGFVVVGNGGRIPSG
jgi:FdhD protein